MALVDLSQNGNTGDIITRYCMAGSDTSQVAITSTLFYCLHFADMLMLLQAEVRAALDVVEEIYVLVLPPRLYCESM